MNDEMFFNKYCKQLIINKVNFFIWLQGALAKHSTLNTLIFELWLAFGLWLHH